MPRRPWRSLNSFSASPMRVPLDQSGAAAAARWIARSGLRDCSARVRRVSRVANTNASASRPLPAAHVRNCSRRARRAPSSPRCRRASPAARTTRRRRRASRIGSTAGAQAAAQRAAHVDALAAAGTPYAARAALRGGQLERGHQPVELRQLVGRQRVEALLRSTLLVAGSATGTSDLARVVVAVARWPRGAVAEEVLRSKHFDALSPGELATLYRLMERLEMATPVRRTRRSRRDRHGKRIDMRRTLRGSTHTAGDPIRLARRRRRVARRRMVLLCDISGSMEPYARAYLQFLTCAAGSARDAEAFVFATRLTRLTRALRSRSPERAIQRAAATAPDWSSGTRIGDALKEFNDRHGRRGMARGAVVVILSDGWERGDPALVGARDGAPVTPRPPDRVGEPARRGEWLLASGRRYGRGDPALRRARQRAQPGGAG